MRAGSPIFLVAGPLMRSIAEEFKKNIGLAIRDRDEMVHVESVRYNRKVSLRNVVAGLRVPIALTSLGRAYLAKADQAERDSIMSHIKDRRPSEWGALEAEIACAAKDVATRGYCAASWQPEVVALATPLLFTNHPIHALNVSVAGRESRADVDRKSVVSGQSVSVSVALGGRRSIKKKKK